MQESQESIRLRNFWNGRYQTFQLQESGMKNLTPAYNALLYRCKKEAYLKALRITGADRAVSFLDGGCGQGFFANVVQMTFPSAIYTGVDIAQKAIDHLRQVFPKFNWLCGDLADTLPELDRQEFDVVQSIEVLHLTLSDETHARAVGNLASHLKTNGVLILTDTLPAERYFPNEYICFRPRVYYDQLFERLDLKVVDVLPIYYWIPTIGSMNGMAPRILRRFPRELIYALDRLFLSLGVPHIWNSHDAQMKMLVCVKRA